MVDLRDFDLSNKSAARSLRKTRKESVKLRSEYFPRIHDIHEIARFVSLFSEYGEISHEDIGRQSSQGLNHVMHACKILNLISSEGKLTKLTAGFHVREMREKLSLVALGISSSKPVENGCSGWALTPYSLLISVPLPDLSKKWIQLLHLAPAEHGLLALGLL